MTTETDKAVLQMIASPDATVRASGLEQQSQRCVDRVAYEYGKGRDSADVVAKAVVAECRGRLIMQANLEEGAGAGFDESLAVKVAEAERRAVILIVRDRAAKCI